MDDPSDREGYLSKYSGLDESSSSSRQSSPALLSSIDQLAVNTKPSDHDLSVLPVTVQEDKMHPALNTLEEMPFRAKVFSYLQSSSPNFFLINKSEDLEKVFTDHSTESKVIWKVSTDLSSEISTTSSTPTFSSVSAAVSLNKNPKKLKISKWMQKLPLQKNCTDPDQLISLNSIPESDLLCHSTSIG